MKSLDMKGIPYKAMSNKKITSKRAKETKTISCRHQEEGITSNHLLHQLRSLTIHIIEGTQYIPDHHNLQTRHNQRKNVKKDIILPHRHE